MLRWTRSFSRRAILASTLAAATITAAGAATYHRLAVTTSNGGGSGGALEVLQTSSSGGALQGEVATSPSTNFAYPFGLFGIYDASSSTFGIGTVGFSATGYGVAGATKSSYPSILALAQGSGPALEAKTTSTSTTSGSISPAIVAEPAGYDGNTDNGKPVGADGIDAVIHGSSTDAASAVYGDDESNTNSNNVGVLGESYGDAYGVAGLVVPESNGGPQGQAGVHGEASGRNNYGVTGDTDVGNGLLGLSTSGVGVEAVSDTGSGARFYENDFANASPAPYVFQQDGVNATAQNGAGVYAYSAQDPAIAGETSCNVSITSPTEEGRNCSGLFVQEDYTQGYPLLVYEPNSKQSCPNPKYPFFVNSAGDILLCGKTMTAQVYQRNANPASDAVSYAAKQTESTVEDFGSAQLVNGAASVALAADFRQTIDAGADYLVFATPHGDSRGLYVASENQNGFVIRESQGGRSTMAFDYRIVAQPYGRRLARLPHESDVIADRPIARPSQRTSYAQLVLAAQARNRAFIPSSKRLLSERRLSMRPHRYVPPSIPADFASALRRITSTATP